MSRELNAVTRHDGNIKALHRHHADKLHHEQKYMAPTSVV